MKERQQFELWKEEVKPAIHSKVDEFHFLGYDRATAEDIWECTMHQLRKEKEYVHLHALVNEILTLKPQSYMNWLTMDSYQNPIDYFAEADQAGN